MVPDNRFEEVVLHVFRRDGDTAESIQLDKADLLILTVARHLFMCPDSPNHPNWRIPFQFANKALAALETGIFMKAMRRIVDSLQCVRSTDFNFILFDDVTASRLLTPEEKCLIQFMHCLRNGNRAAAETQLIMLCEGGERAIIKTEALRANSVLIDCSERLNSA